MSIFYMTQRNGYYQLRLSANHYCISAGSDLSVRLNVAERYIKKYKNSEGILRVINSLNYGGTVPTADVVRCTEILRNKENVCEEELRELEERCLEFNRDNTPLKRTQKVLSKLVRKSPEPLENRVVEVIPPVVKKPKLFKRTVLS